MPSITHSEAAIPNPALAAFGPFIGNWRTEGTHPLVPGVVFHGQSSFEWLENGAFVIMHSSMEEEQIPSGIAIFGSDNDTGELFMLYFDERKISRKYDVSFQGNELKWWRTTPKFSQRCSLIISADGNSITSKGVMSQEGKAWEDDLSLTCFRMDS